jgi:hypothetical protein
MRTNSRNWDPIGLSEFNCTASIPRNVICNSAIGNSNWGNWDPQFQCGQLANWQFNPIQFPQFNDGNSIGLAKEAELMPSPSCGQRAMTAWGSDGSLVRVRRIDAGRVLFFPILKTGPVHTPPAPGIGGRVASESLACLQFLDAGGNVSGTVPRMGVDFKIGVGGHTSRPPCILKPRFGGAIL